MKKKFLLYLLSLVMVLGMLPQASAAAENQVVYPGGSVLYNAAGQKVNGTELGDNDSVVKISKTIEQYKKNGTAVENEFVVTLQVQTSENIKEIGGDTPDSAVLLVMDISNSMDDCIHCGNEANHSSHSGTSTTTYYCSGTSGNTFSTWGNNRYCRHCDKLRSQHNAVTTTTSGSCAYQSRLDATKTAAKDFLYEFANETAAQTGDRRMVAIAAYGTHAVTALNWVDITTTEGMSEAENAVDSLTIANGNYRTNLQGGGTSIESGLALGRNLLGQSAVSNIDYRYTILLTDGQPTYPANNPNSTGTTSISGSTGNSGSSTQQSDVDNVPAIAQSIRNLSKLYSICFGKVDNEDVWNLKPFGSWSGSNPAWSTNNQTTVGSWLTSFSTAAYKAADASTAKLFESFNSILSQIQVAAKAWKVEDWMGDYLVYEGPVTVPNSNGGYVNNVVNTTPNAADYPDGVPAFVWDLLTSENDPAITNWNATSETGVLGYTYQYRATLDNLDARYSTTDGHEENPSNKATDANKLATLRYATTDENGNWPESTDDYKTVPFPVPQVQGLVGTLTFEKVDQDGDPLSGWTFRLRSNQYSEHPDIADQWAYVDATSNADGVVTFTGIPSGHSYTLLEAEKPAGSDHYLDAGDFTVDIAWSNASVYNSSGTLTDSEDSDSHIELVNEYNVNELGKLTLQKRFADGSTIPTSIRFHIDGPNGFSVNRELNSGDAQSDGTWSWTMTGLEFGEYTVRETNAIDTHGNRLRDTHDLVYSILVDGDSKVTNQSFVEGQSEPQIKVELKSTDEDKTVAVQFVNNMTRKQGALAITKSFVDLPANLVNANMGLTMKVTATPVDANGEAISGEQPVTLNLVWNGTAYAASAKLPIGRYRLTEELTGTVPGYSLLHYMFEQNGAEVEDGIVKIDANTNLAVTLKNHYEQDKGRIYINKSFAGDLAAANFEGRVIYVNIRENDKDGDIVATVMLDEGDGEWTAESPELPVGTYYLEEVVAENEEGTAYVGNYTHAVTWAPGATVDLTKNALVSIGLTNTYTQDKGFIQIAKTFAEDSELGEDYFEGKSITVDILDANNTIVDTLTLTKGSWTDTSIALPVGAYTLVENGAEVENYTLEQSWTNVAEGTTSSVSVAKGETTDVSLSNKYTQKKGYLKVVKEIEGLSDNLISGVTVTITVKDAVTGQTVGTLTLPKDGKWEDAIQLPVGSYKLEESGADVQNYALAIGWSGLTDGVVAIGETNTEAAPAAVIVKNTYTQDMGYIQVTKQFTGDLTAADFVNKTITIDIYSGNAVVDSLTLSGTQLTDTSIALPVGTYTLVESGAEVENYTLEQSWTNVAEGTTSSVSVTKGETTNVSLSNKYTQKKGYLTVTKIFEGLPVDVREDTAIAILIKDESGTVAATLNLFEGKWSDTVVLPVGFYTLEETGASKDEYALTASWKGLTDRKIEIKEEHTQQAAAQVSVTNKYTAEFGYLTIVKKLSGLESPDSQFVFDVKDASGARVQRVTVEVAGDEGSSTIKLPLGRYTVEELLLTQREDSRYEVSWNPANPGNQNNALVTISADQTEAVTVICTNTNVPKATVRIPVQKTVKVTGNTVPGEMTFTFGAEWSNSANADLDVSFEDASGSTAGYVEQIAENAYTITVDGEGTVKGYIVISGYASELDGFQLTTWEKPNPYGSVQAAKAAYWSYDQTAQSNTLRWKVTLKANGHSLGYDIALGTTGSKEAIAFENTYEKVEAVVLPETGDNDMPLLYLLLIVLSASGILMLRKKFAK